MGKKMVFIIPGFKHTPSNKGYKAIAKILKEEGHTPVPIKIPWNQRTISENTEYFIDKYQKKVSLQTAKRKRKKTYILGFSFGAMIAFIASTKINVDGLILCSLSPYFKEDLPKTVTSNSPTEKSRYNDFSKLRSSSLAKETTAKKVLMLYGSEESKPLIHRVTKTFREVNSSYKYLLPIDKAKHDITDKKYLYMIQQIACDLI